MTLCCTSVQTSTAYQRGLRGSLPEALMMLVSGLEHGTGQPGERVDSQAQRLVSLVRVPCLASEWAINGQCGDCVSGSRTSGMGANKKRSLIFRAWLGA